jgi:hypothetical protein
MARKEVLERIEKYVHPFRITKGKKFRLKDFDPGDTAGLEVEKGEAADIVPLACAPLTRSSSTERICARRL